MVLTKTGCVFMGFIMYITGCDAQTKKICALKGSSVELRCSANHTSNNKWYTIQKNGSAFVQNVLAADGNHVTYNMPEENQLTLMVKGLTESDAALYCCLDSPQLCWQNAAQLNVSDLQVKVLPTPHEQTVSLMCSTSCPLTETSVVYIWYKNGEHLYEDQSPWYQELVSSEEGVRYSCAVKGYEDLRAPDVSVDSVTSTCFTVTYSKGRMCSYEHKSEEEPCSITFPTEVQIRSTPLTTPGQVTLTCSPSCPLTEPLNFYTWYRNRCRFIEIQSPKLFRGSSNDSFFCAVKNLEHLHSASICTDAKNCWSVNYVSRRICVLEGSSVNISAEYSHPNKLQPKSKVWYKTQRGGEDEAEQLIKATGRLTFHEYMNQHVLMITKVEKTDSGEYTFILQKDNKKCTWPELPQVTLVVTGLKVKMHPPVATEGQRVTLSCSTSCPLPGNKSYIWSFNGQTLMLPQKQNKHLVLDPFSSQFEGNYSCTIRNGQINISSSEITVTVINVTGEHIIAAASGVAAALLVIICLIACCWTRIKRTSRQCPRSQTSENTKQLGSDPLYENISAPPAQQDDHHYSRLTFSKNHTEDLYSTIQPVAHK